MGAIFPGDAVLHYSDGSHRWLHPADPTGDARWAARVRAHLAAHASGAGERSSVPSGARVRAVAS
jgi:hypothetical protein